VDLTRFDRLGKLFAERRLSRRTALSATSRTAMGIGPATAQEATPVATPASYPDDPHPSADTAQASPEFLFVQPFDSGTWAPLDAAAGTYTLTLSGAAAQTVYFSDRPERIVGLAPTQLFLDGLGFTPENPPNAALVADTGTGETEILVIELFDPVYDADAGTLTYDARVLADYAEPGLASLARQQTDYDYPATFGDGSLFIDSCPDGTVTCMNHFTGQVVGSFGIGYCWTSSWCCQVCCTDCDYELQCTQQFGDACNNGQEGYYCSAEFYPLPALHC
jgi:hypothetical protein